MYLPCPTGHTMTTMPTPPYLLLHCAACDQTNRVQATQCRAHPLCLLPVASKLAGRGRGLGGDKYCQ